MEFKLSPKSIELLYPLSLISTGFINLLMSICGAGSLWENSKITDMVAYSAYALILLVLGVHFCKCTSKKVIVQALALLIVFSVPYFIFFSMNGFNSHYILNLFIKSLGFCVPAGIVAISIIVEKCVDKFIEYFYVYNIIVLPFEVFYIVRFNFGDEVDNTRRDFGLLNYMSIAYLILVLFIFVAISLFVVKRNANRRIKWGLLIIDWVAIMYSGTRGAIIACIACCIIIIIYKCFVVKDECKYKAIILLLILLSTYVFSIYVWSPISAATNWRFNNFIHESEELSNEENAQIKDLNIKEIKLQATNYIVENDRNIDVSLKNLEKQMVNQYDISKDDAQLFLDTYIFTNRIDLYKISIKEFEKNWLVGNGPLAFAKKYNGYPHNIILEILVDYGVIGCFVFGGGIIFIFYRIFPLIKQYREIAGISIYALSIGVTYLVSGTIYFSCDLVFIFSCALYLAFNINKFKLASDI